MASAGPELYRLSLDEGRFLSPYATGLSDLTSVSVSKDHFLVSLGKNHKQILIIARTAKFGRPGELLVEQGFYRFLQ